MDEELIGGLVNRFPEILHTNVRLSDISQWRTGGVADVIIRPKSIASYLDVQAYFRRAGTTPIVIGSTSNLLFSDRGLRCPCIQIGPWFASTRVTRDTICAESGVSAQRLARISMSLGYRDLAHIVGIPGTLGGLIYMNGGSCRQSISSSLAAITSVDKEGKCLEKQPGEIGFAHRWSGFQSNGEFIASATLQLNDHVGRSVARKEMLSILRSRRLKFPLQQPNCGSTFVSDPTLYERVGPPGKIIEELGFKGYRVGGAQVSERHANFIVNCGGALSADILSLIHIIRTRVYEETGHLLAAEVRYVDENGIFSPAHKVLN
ncbi:UDP-N-acetylmuramate dehydrogenase [Ideonella sp. 4Y11]|uniref:UDP-N-acetylenolpyruvoylglucosamine reductase n=1 Tax=Ideonella aquatica TaxID=2824119 RepID=A0A940YP47_9BURK|nr:UDP-N-acetylmuramate dehydrogenase [Ideonella aquatica]MBQ0959926.1 UDP-N-acetylmuramate dehydrogenase [Ideonella aquatica]